MLWLSPIVLIATNIFVLTNILDTTLYVSTPNNNIVECYITMDYTNAFDNTWPSKWKRMSLNYDNVTGSRCFIDLAEELTTPPDVLNYMVRYLYADGYIRGTENWQSILWSTYDNNNNNESTLYTTAKQQKTTTKQPTNNTSTQYTTQTNNQTLNKTIIENNKRHIILISCSIILFVAILLLAFVFAYKICIKLHNK
jgi:hypothetical protein